MLHCRMQSLVYSLVPCTSGEVGSMKPQRRGLIRCFAAHALECMPVISTQLMTQIINVGRGMLLRLIALQLSLGVSFMHLQCYEGVLVLLIGFGAVPSLTLLCVFHSFQRANNHAAHRVHPREEG
jgi:hypothetical protein